ncbi:MAG: hypothetical protein HZA81_00615 [Candidatus Taylorbacteria bacterium]|nr:hypothetical protein [Candidatus Taylorbacteria bacterium]
MPEQHVARFLEKMLDHLKLTGSFQLHVQQKIKGSEHHRGAECEGIVQYNAVRLKVQTSDNGSRYLCYLRSEEMKPRDLSSRIMSILPGGCFDESMLKPKERPADAADAQAPAAEAAPSAPKEKVSLSGVADDPIQVAMFLISIRLKHGMDSFDTKSFMGIAREYAPTANKATTSQLLRRIVANGYLSTEGDGLKKRYRFSPEGVRLLAEHDKFVAESARTALNVTDTNALSEQFVALEARARQHAEAAQRLVDLNSEIGSETCRIEEIERQLEAAKARREDLRKQASAEQKIIEDPALTAALANYQAVQKILKSTS